MIFYSYEDAYADTNDLRLYQLYSDLELEELNREFFGDHLRLGRYVRNLLEKAILRQSTAINF